mgnify:CR=1 FL=1
MLMLRRSFHFYMVVFGFTVLFLLLITMDFMVYESRSLFLFLDGISKIVAASCFMLSSFLVAVRFGEQCGQ